MAQHIDTLSEADKKKWLKQRGWLPRDRGGIPLWRDPETGHNYTFAVALGRAKAGCKLPADFELHPT